MSDPSYPRPRNVVVVDADNPMVEVRGEFFWKDDHDRILADAEDEAFDRGFAQGYAAGQATPTQIVIRRQRTVSGLMFRLILALLTASFLVSLALSLVGVVVDRL